MGEVTDPQVLNLLARELLSVSSERAAARPETETVKRVRRLDLEEELHPRADRPHTLAEQLEHAEVMGGRIFNLPADHLDRVARLATTSRRRRHIRAAQQQIDRRQR